jgi:hypothetical protein
MIQAIRREDIQCMRGLVSTLAASAASDKDLVKELAQMESRIKQVFFSLGQRF